MSANIKDLEKINNTNKIKDTNYFVSSVKDLFDIINLKLDLNSTINLNDIYENVKSIINTIVIIIDLMNNLLKDYLQLN